MAVTVLAVMAAGAHALSFSAPALAEQDRLNQENERRVIADPPTAASDGLPVPALAGAVVLAFAVGIAGGQVRQRRRAAHRRTVASARPAPVAAAPARPAPPPPEPETPASQPREITIAPAAPAAPAPPPPTPPDAHPSPPDVGPPVPAAPAPPPPEVEAAPPEIDMAPPVAPAAPPPAPPAAPRPETRPEEPLRLLARARARTEAPLTEAPEVPRAEPAASAPPPGPAVPLETAPEAVRPPDVEEPSAVPARRFARPVPWPQEAEQLWTCEIAWKAGYLKSSFRAMAGPPGPGKRRSLGDSPSVRWTLMGEPEPPTPELAIRVRALVDALEAAGWEHIGRGRLWYAQRFVWRGSGEPQPIEVPDIAEPAER